MLQFISYAQHIIHVYYFIKAQHMNPNWLREFWPNTELFRGWGGVTVLLIFVLFHLTEMSWTLFSF